MAEAGPVEVASLGSKPEPVFSGCGGVVCFWPVASLLDSGGGERVGIDARLRSKTV